LQVSIDNEELRDLRTIGDVKVYLSAKAMGEKPPTRSKTYRIEEIASLMGVTRERVRQIEFRALRKLRHPTRIVMLTE